MHIAPNLLHWINSENEQQGKTSLDKPLVPQNHPNPPTWWGTRTSTLPLYEQSSDTLTPQLLTKAKGPQQVIDLYIYMDYRHLPA